jgi:mannose-6-phosphate isomerase-like protein (cupin superfamily)
VIEDARAHGLVLAETGRLYDTKKGERPPEGVGPMPLLTDEELAAFPETPVEAVVPRFIGRYHDMTARAKDRPCRVIGAGDALIADRPGFEVELLTRDSIPPEPYATDRHEVLMVHRGHWRLGWEGGAATLAPGDTCAVPPGLAHSLAPSITGEAALFRIRNTDDPAGPTAGSA